MVRVTFTLDDDTVMTLRRTAARLHKPQSRVVREAIGEYAARTGKLSEEERTRMLKILDTMLPAIPRRPAREVDAELREIRRARRRWGRHSRDRE
jgi:hypothetical protein